MFIRSMMLALAIGSVVACVEPTQDQTDETAAVEQRTGGFDCHNKSVISGVECLGVIAIFPIDIDVKNVGVLSNNDLDVLNHSLNDLSILNGGILNHNKILNDAELTVLDDFLNKFDIDVTKNDIDVCTTVLGLLLCK
jgi:hypothetical protein